MATQPEFYMVSMQYETDSFLLFLSGSHLPKLVSDALGSLSLLALPPSCRNARLIQPWQAYMVLGIQPRSLRRLTQQSTHRDTAPPLAEFWRQGLAT